MNFTQEQISEILQDIANEIDGFNRLQTFVNNWESKYPSLKSYRNAI
jgi:hypothetical protein